MLTPGSLRAACLGLGRVPESDARPRRGQPCHDLRRSSVATGLRGAARALQIVPEPGGGANTMVDELDEARERAKAAWSLVQADVVRLKEAFRSEVDHVKQLGPKS